MFAPTAGGCKRLFGGDASQLRTVPAARVPQRQHLNGIVDRSVVKVVPDSRQGHATDVREPRTAWPSAHLGLSEEKTKSAIQILDDGVGCSRSVLGPPSRRRGDVALGRFRDVEASRPSHADRRSCSRNRSQEMT
jgi:hypothetical protein